MEILFPGSSKVDRAFPVEIASLQAQRPGHIGPFAIIPYRVEHASGAPAFALRLESSGKVIAYSGDTEWTDTLVCAAQGADLFIVEAYFYRKQVRYHLDYSTLKTQLHRLNSKRVVLTHVSTDMLNHVAEIQHEIAEDGMVIEV